MISSCVDYVYRGFRRSCIRICYSFETPSLHYYGSASLLRFITTGNDVTERTNRRAACSPPACGCPAEPSVGAPGPVRAGRVAPLGHTGVYGFKHEFRRRQIKKIRRRHIQFFLFVGATRPARTSHVRRDLYSGHCWH